MCGWGGEERRRRVPSCSCCVQHEEKLIKGTGLEELARWEVRPGCTVEPSHAHLDSLLLSEMRK